MKFACDSCNAQYMISDEKVGTKGVKVRCKKCSHIIVVKPQPAVAAETSGALGGDDSQSGDAFGSVFGSNPFEQATTAMSRDQLDALRAESETAPQGGFGGALTTAAAPSAQAPESGDTPAPDPFAAQQDEQSAAPDPFSDSAPQDQQAADSSTAPAPMGSEGSDSGVFGESGFFGSGGGGDTAPSDDAPAGEKEWYVAIDDNQVGPIDVAEIQQKWDDEEISEDTLVWKPGLDDWMPIADTSELQYLVTDRPQQKSAGANAVTGNTSAPAVDWKPSAASALSSLVQEELVAEEKPKPPPSSPPGGSGMPDFGGANDLFGSGSGDPFAAPAAPPAPDPFAGGGAPAWASTKKSSNGLVITLLVLVVMIIGGGGTAAFLFKDKLFAAFAPPPPTPVAEKKDEAAKKEDTKEEAPKEEQQEAAESEKAAPKKQASRSGSSKRGSSRRSGSSSRSNSGGSGGGGAPPPPPPSSDVKAKLSMQDIISGAKKHGRKVLPCLEKARSRGELVPNRYTFKLDWQILPTGRVTGARLTGPSSVMNTSLPRCFASVMKTWKFPASRDGAPVRNFPFGPITIK